MPKTTKALAAKKGGLDAADLDFILTEKKARAIVLLELGCQQKDVAEAVGLSLNTIKKCKQGKYVVPVEMVDALRNQEDMKLTMVAHRMVDSLIDMDEKTLAKATLPQRMTAAAIAIDKRELLSGRPTHRYEVQMSDPDLDQRIEDLRRIVDGEDVVLEAEDDEGQSFSARLHDE